MSVQKFLKQRAVKIAVDGHYTLANWYDPQGKLRTFSCRTTRLIPASPHSALTLADGTIHSCTVIDMSVSGAAVAAPVQPEIGTPLAIGACVGRVVRLLPDGFAVRFVEPLKRHDLERLIARSPLPSASAALAKADLDDVPVAQVGG